MEEIFKIIESYGLTLVLLIGALYALYKFFFFSIHEVKNTFSRHHEKNAENMQEIKKVNICLLIKKPKKKDYIFVEIVICTETFCY